MTYLYKHIGLRDLLKQEQTPSSGSGLATPPAMMPFKY